MPQSTSSSWIYRVFSIWKTLTSPVAKDSVPFYQTWDFLKRPDWDISLSLFSNNIFGTKFHARRSNLSILKEINPECSLEGLMLKLKLHYFGYLVRRTDSLGKTLILEKTEGRRRRGQRRMRWLDGIINSKHESEQTLGDSDGQGSLACCIPWS